MELGNLDAQRDWGFAGDYVDGMWRMLQQEKPDDFVLATGSTTTVRDFVNGAAAAFGFELEWTVKGQLDGIDKTTGREPSSLLTPALYRPTEVASRSGDPSKAKAELDWEAKTSSEELIEMMTRADHDRMKTGILRC